MIMDEIYCSHEALEYFMKEAKCHENIQGTLK